MKVHEIYLDNAATTQPMEELKELFNHYVDSGWYNPSAAYDVAMELERQIVEAKELIKTVTGARKASVLFTSCGTEGDNTAILEGYRPQGNRKLHFITSIVEHPAVYETFKLLERRGHEVSYLRPNAHGEIMASSVLSQVRPNTVLCSLMHVNNETGAINDIGQITQQIKRINPNIMMHVDGVQGFLKAPVAFDEWGIDYYTISAHKIHGLKGTGALIYRDGAPLKPYIIGGGQEKGLRSGTENTFGILAMKKANELFMPGWEENISRMEQLKRQCAAGLSQLEGVHILTDVEHSAPHILYVAIEGIRGEVLLHLLEKDGIYISTGSACSARKKKVGRIAGGIGLNQKISEGVIRISFCEWNNSHEVDVLIQRVIEHVQMLRRYTRR